MRRERGGAVVSTASWGRERRRAPYRHAVPGDHETLTLAELVATLALATDLAMAHPLEQGLGACLVSTRMAELAGLPLAEVRQTFYVALLRHIGCTTENQALAHLVGDEVALSGALNPLTGATGPEYIGAFVRFATAGRSRLDQARAVGRIAAGVRGFTAANRAICEVAQALATRLGLEPAVVAALGTVYERWDGKGMPHRIRGEAIPRPVRVSQVGDLVAALHDLGHEDVIAVVASRSGTGLDPAAVDVFRSNTGELLDLLSTSSRWHAVQRVAPLPAERLTGDRLEQALHVVADFADLKSPYLVGHSAGVADLARTAARRLRLPPSDADELAWAGLVHDVGRVGVSAGIWGRPGPLRAGEWETVRLHPYQTERVLGRAPFLARLSALASLHHERLDGSGYFRGSPAAQLPPAARVLAAADAYHAMREPRPHRPPLTAPEAATELDREVRSGHLDRECVDAVLAAAGHRTGRRKQYPGGLTAREVEVLRLLARGARTREIAQTLVIAPKTAGNHIQSIYDKTGVTTRAAATVFAMQHGLIDPFAE
jgi:HD-GYP domain-containing protein (c-di-GMP phosphodiesterase class II)